MKAIDFTRSFMTFSVKDPTNSARIQLDAACEWTDEKTGERDMYYLITPCKSETMYKDKALFQVPNYDFCGVWSAREYLIIRTHASHDRDNREVGLNQKRFGEVKLDIRHYDKTEALTSEKEIVEATLANELMTAVTEIRDEGRQVRAVLEYPMKTMNVDPDAVRLLVDTGPLAWPDFEADVEQTVGRFHRAFVVYNRFDKAEFVIERPTVVDDRNDASPYTAHYSDIREVAAKNRLYRVGTG